MLALDLRASRCGPSRRRGRSRGTPTPSPARRRRSPGYGKTVSSGISPGEERLHDGDEARVGRRAGRGAIRHGAISLDDGWRVRIEAPRARWRARGCVSAGAKRGPEPLGEIVQAREHAVEAERVGVAQQPAAERRKAGAEDHREVELAPASPTIAVLEAERRLVDHRQDEPRLDRPRRAAATGSRRLDAAGPRRPRATGRRRLPSVVLVEALAVLAAEPARRRPAPPRPPAFMRSGNAACEDLAGLGRDVEADVVEQRERPDRHAEIASSPRPRPRCGSPPARGARPPRGTARGSG